MKENFQLFSSISNYLLNKRKVLSDLNKLKDIRQENLKKLLQESLSDQNILGKTFSTKLIKDDEFKNISDAYKKGHMKNFGYIQRYDIDSNPNSNFRKTQNKLFNKYNINPNLTFTEKIYLDRIKSNSKRKHINIDINSDTNYYSNQYDSFTTLQKNKNLFNIILLNQGKELINHYMEKGFIDEQNILKLKLMPKTHIIDISKYKKDKDNSNIINKISNKSDKKRKKDASKDILFNLNTFMNLNKISRKEFFEEYNYVYIKAIDKYVSTPTCRHGAQMLLYTDDITEDNKIFLFGGANIKSLNDIWECLITNTNKSEKKYIWNKIDITEDIPYSRNGHSMSLFQGNIFIYGGIIEEIGTKAREDILIYNIKEQKFTIDYTLNKGIVGCRNYHIAEVVGTHMLIYGGANEKGDILADPFALDLYNMKWVKAKFNTDNLPKRKFHSSCQVFPHLKRINEKFFLFKINNEINIYNSDKILVEGIYIFGGINENLICTNDLLIIKRGKPLQLFKGITKGSPPIPRCQCSMDFYEKLNVIVIYGGKNDKSKDGPFFNDMFFLDLQTLSWINIELNNDNIFPPRGSHCSCLCDNELIIFGGINEKYLLKSDLLVCNLDIFENYKTKRNLQVKIKKRKERESLSINNEVFKKILSSRNRISINERIYSNKKLNENSNNSIVKNKPEHFSYNFFKTYPKLRNFLQEKFKEIDNINFNSSDNQKIEEIIKENAFIS